MSFASSHMNYKQRMIKNTSHAPIGSSGDQYKNDSYHGKAKENVGKKFTNKDTLERLAKKHTSEAVL